VKPTRPSVLIAAFLLAGAVAAAVVQLTYDSLPALPHGPVIIVVAVAVAELLLAWTTRNRLRAMREEDAEKRREQAHVKPIEPMLVARLAALARASSLTGALVGGVWTAVLVVLFWHRSVDAVNADRRLSAFGIASSVLLVGAALWLEWVCRAPPPPEQREQTHAHAA
jgi:NADH:ubiquinone oxidoreductase subunit 5 (subunit L)/multisubunit Na+/H+ antiporter MnhA subunit